MKNGVRNTYFSWSIIALIIACLLFFPLLFVLEGFRFGEDENVLHIKSFLLKDMVFTTIRMILGVGLVSLVLALPTAYFVSNYEFPLRKFLRKASMLPIAIPTYIMGFAYASIFSISGSFYDLAEIFYDRETLYSWNIDVLKEGWLMIFLGFALFPYVYSAALVSFSIKNKSIDEAAASIGVGVWQRFWRVGFPMVVPALVSGFALVAMEVLNDFGAMSYYNVNTITAGIFQAKQMDFTSSVYLSALFFVVIASIFIIYYLVKSLRNVASVVVNAPTDLPKLKGGKAIFISFLISLPFILGFVIPVAELLRLASNRVEVIFSQEFLSIIIDSFQLAIIPALIIVVLVLVLLYNQYINKSYLSKIFSAISNIGYAIPGAIIAVAVMAFVLVFDEEEKSFYYFLMDSLILILFAYVIRFMAVGYNTLESGFNRISTTLPDAGRSLGKNSFLTFIKVYLPLLKNAIFTALAIVTVDILKELPITLLLQPFNFDTLATITYEKAKVSESIRDASPYALLLIFVGAIVVLFLVDDSNSKLKNNNAQDS